MRIFKRLALSYHFDLAIWLVGRPFMFYPIRLTPNAQLLPGEMVPSCAPCYSSREKRTWRTEKKHKSSGLYRRQWGIAGMAATIQIVVAITRKTGRQVASDTTHLCWCLQPFSPFHSRTESTQRASEWKMLSSHRSQLLSLRQDKVPRAAPHLEHWLPPLCSLSSLWRRHGKVGQEHRPRRMGKW